jgi:predicted DCC family thiol-disulfide oxidoreductase YuxK
LNKKPLLIYDGECGFCSIWISRWQAITGNSIDYATYQEVASNYPQISKSQFQNSIQLIESDHKFFSGAEAIFKTLAYSPERRWLLKLYESIPGFAFIAELGYRIIARNRHAFSKLSNFF